ncbi:hypothetical protein T484DRAFT_1855675 [Baffinella frigidus]|nr:hypothetical protein T484DRAFT_1855675 [Cryptophyta sp. CCMP2293]
MAVPELAGSGESSGRAHRGSMAVMMRTAAAAALLLMAAAAVIALASSPESLAASVEVVSKAVAPAVATEAPEPKIALAPVVKSAPAPAVPVKAAAATQPSLKAAPIAVKLTTKQPAVEVVPAVVPAAVPAVVPAVVAVPAAAQVAVPVVAAVPVAAAAAATPAATEAAAAVAAPLPKASISSMVKEIKALQAQEAQTSHARAAALAKALAHKPGKSSPDDGGERSWRKQKSQYERAALKDIEKGQKMDTAKEKHLDLQGQAAKMFAKYDKQAEDLMGTKELHQLTNRSMEHDALIALRKANQQLRQVEATERKEAHARHKQTQDKAVAKTQAKGPI